jgi:AcrR family transcriptional regulator
MKACVDRPASGRIRLSFLDRSIKKYPMPRPGRHAEGARTRERVLACAAALIAGQGYAATSIQQISRRSGANPASIYWAFGSKEGLLAAVMEHAAAGFFGRLERPDGSDPWRWLADLADSFADGPEFLRLLLVLSLERRGGDPVLLAAARRVRGAATGALATAYAEAFGIDDPFRRRAICERLARFTLMLIDGAFVASQIEPDDTDLRRAFETIALAVKATGERLLAEGGADAPVAPATPRPTHGDPR